MQDKRYATEPSFKPTSERIARAVPAVTGAAFFGPLSTRRLRAAKGYRMVPTPGAVSPTDCDTDVDGVSLQVRWGDNTLAVHHLDQGRDFFAGETESADLLVPADLLGQDLLPLVLDGAVVLPEGATGTVEMPGEEDHEMSLDETIASGATQPCPQAAGAVMLPIGAGMVIRLTLGDLTIEVRGEKKSRRLRAFTLAALASGAAACIGGSFAAHAGLLGAMALMMPPMSADGDDGLTDDQRYLIQQAIDVQAERELEEQDVTAQNEGADQGGEQGKRHGGDEGAAGDEMAPPGSGRIAIKDRGPQKAVGATRAELIENASTFGLINVLSGTPGPQSDIGAQFASGLDAVDANGTMWGDDPGDAFGPGGLGLTGIGEGGGYHGKTYGLGRIGTVGPGFCRSGDCGDHGFGGGNGLLPRGHKARPPKMHSAAQEMTGQLPPEVIQRIVRNNYGRFRACYEGALRNNPNLSGRVVVNFVIGRDGSVSSVGGGGDLPDAGVVSCVASNFRGLTFPPPEHGIVTVSYPIVFTPGG